jgi:hypothetical protein
VKAEQAVVLVDDGSAAWSSWNLYAEEFAAATGATVERIDDEGITGPAYFEHVRRLRRPVLSSPKRTGIALPPDLVQRQVDRPTPYWTWSLVSRENETRPAVLAAIEALTQDVQMVDDEDAWLPAADPFR